MSIADKLTTIAANEERVFIAGQLIGEGHGYDLGYDTGYSYGKSDGFADGFDEGNNKGHAAGYEEGYGVGHQDGLTDGFAEGKQAAETECALKHFVQIIPGSGTTELTFNVPFEIGCLSIITNDPSIRTQANTVAYFDVDVEAFGQFSGKGGLSSAANNGGGSYMNALYSYSGMLQRFTQADTGEVTVKNIIASDNGTIKTGIFSADVDYLVVAAKVENSKPIKTRIEESVSNISDIGTWTVYYQIEKLKEAYGDDYANNAEWTALMASKPNCTFSLV